MGAFGGLILTNKGRMLQAKAQTGTPLVYTRIAIGDGNLTSQQITDLTALISPKKSLPITRLNVQPGGEAVVGTYLSNGDITTGFYFREMGLFATDPTEGEILYSYGNAGAGAEYIPAGGGPDLAEKFINAVALVGNASNISASISGSLIYVQQLEFNSHKSASVLDHPDSSVTTAKLAPKSVTAAKIADSTIGSGQLAAGSATDTVLGNRTLIDTTAFSLTGTLTNLLSGILNLIKGITGKSSVTAAPAITLEATSIHVNAGSAHGSTSAATINAIMQRDALGRAKVAAPAASDDIARKDTVDNVQTNLTNHSSATTGIHGATSAATANALVQRDASGRFQVADPSAAQDVATKSYVDAIKQGLDIKDSVRLSTTANITLSGTQSVDGVTANVGDRVLVKNQTTASQNGPYLVAAGAWTRTTDADTNAKVTSGMYCYVTEGATQASNGYILTTPDPIVLGTTALTFTQFSGAGQINAGAAMTKTGNTLDITVDGVGIEINSDALRLKDGGATDAKIGNRTVNDTTTAAFTGSLTSLLSGIFTVIKGITGKSSALTPPAITLETASSHITATTGIHGATSVATANAIMQRDAAGRAQVVDPSAAQDVSTKAYVDAQVAIAKNYAP